MSVGTSGTNRLEQPGQSHRTNRGNGSTLGDLIKKLRDDTVLLMREEIALAKAETSQKIAKCGRNARTGGVGGAIAFAGVLSLIAAAVTGTYAGLVAAGLAQLVAVWLAPLCVGLVAAVIGYALIQKAVSTIKQESLTPERTVESLERNKEWIKEKV